MHLQVLVLDLGEHAQPPSDLFFLTKVMRVGAAAQVETSSLGHLNSNKLSLRLVPNEERIYSTKSPQERSARTQAEGPNVAEWADYTIRCRVLYSGKK
jgi:hypothetical protein